MERLGVAAAEAGVEMLGGDRQVGVAVMHGQPQQRPPSPRARSSGRYGSSVPRPSWTSTRGTPSPGTRRTSGSSATAPSASGARDMPAGAGATPRAAARAGPRPSSGALRRRSARPRGVGWLSAQRSRRSNGCRRALSSRSRKRAINWAINSESPPAPKKSCSTPSDGLSSTSRQSASSAFSSSSAGACATPCRRSAWGWRAKPVRALRSILPLPVTGRRSSTRNCAGSM